jgi:hypothetical protein
LIRVGGGILVDNSGFGFGLAAYGPWAVVGTGRCGDGAAAVLGGSVVHGARRLVGAKQTIHPRQDEVRTIATSGNLQ